MEGSGGEEKEERFAGAGKGVGFGGGEMERKDGEGEEEDGEEEVVEIASEEARCMRRRLCAGDKEEVAFARALPPPPPSSLSGERGRSSGDVSVSSISSLFSKGLGFVGGRCGGRRGRAGRGRENGC